MGDIAQANQYQLQGGLNDEFTDFYLAIRKAYGKHGVGSKFTQALKQFAEYFYYQAIRLKQYRSLRSKLMRNAQTSGDSQRCELFSDGKIAGFLYALPAKNSISSELFDGNINILTVDHGALQISKKTPIKYKLHHQRLTLGQSSINLCTPDQETYFQAKTNVTIFLSISFNGVIYTPQT
ncbi:MAG: hypothetical protein KAH00_07880 [Cocleimonas sp.]|nr:hypothetical protein [Cocleimonas sp.]